MTTPKKKLTPPPPPRQVSGKPTTTQAAPDGLPKVPSLDGVLVVHIPLAGGKTYEFAILQGESVIPDLDHREAKDLGLAIRDAVRAAKGRNLNT